MNIKLTGEGYNQYLSNLKYPFNKSSIYKINIEIGKQLFETEISCVARIWFQNGDTRGNHKLKNESFTELLKELDSFIKSLEK